jgi:hypothetical protein
MARGVGADRLAAARQVMSMLRQSPSFREIIAANASGERPIVIVSIDDPLEEVVDRIWSIGLPVALVVPGEGRSPTVLTVHERDPQREVPWEPAPAGATIGLVIEQFEAKRAAAVGVPDPADREPMILELVEPPGG